MELWKKKKHKKMIMKNTKKKKHIKLRNISLLVNLYREKLIN